MARQVNAYGFADILIALNPTAGSPTYTDLGTTRDGIGITSDGYFLDVHNDENGGEAGPPIQIQYLGETAKIRIELTKYDPAVFATLEEHFANSGTAGVPQPAGVFMFVDTVASGQLIGTPSQVGLKIKTINATATLVRTYKRCVLHDPVEVNRGTKFSTGIITLTAYKDDSNNLWTEGAT